jgi:adenylate kinase family enzyme
MDGFPSDIAQAASFVQTIGPPMAVIHIDVNPLVMDFRLKTRNNFDDTPESIQKRISIFNDTTRTLLREWKAIKVDGNCPEEEVFESIKLALARENLFHEVELNVNLG